MPDCLIRKTDTASHCHNIAHLLICGPAISHRALASVHTFLKFKYSIFLY